MSASDGTSDIMGGTAGSVTIREIFDNTDSDMLSDHCDGDSPAVKLTLLLDRLLIRPDLEGRGYTPLTGDDARSRETILWNFQRLSSLERNMPGGSVDFIDMYSYDPAGTAKTTHDMGDFAGFHYTPSDQIRFRMALVTFAIMHEDWADRMIRLVENVCAWSARNPPQNMLGTVPSPMDTPGHEKRDDQGFVISWDREPPVPVECLGALCEAICSIFDSRGIGRSNGNSRAAISPESVTMSMIMDTMIDDDDLASMRRSWPQALTRMGAGDDADLVKLMSVLERILEIRAGDGQFSLFHSSLKKEPGYRLWIPPMAALAMVTHPLFGNGTSQAENDVAAAIRAVRSARVKAYILHGLTEDYDNDVLPMPWNVLHGLVSDAPTDVLDAVIFRQTEVMGADSGGWSRDDLERLGGLAESMLDEDWDAIDPEGMMRIARTLWPYGLHGEDTGITLPERKTGSPEVLNNVLNTTVADMLNDAPESLGAAASRADMSAVETLMEELCQQLRTIIRSQHPLYDMIILDVLIPGSAFKEAVKGIGSGLPWDLIMQTLCAECVNTHGCIHEQVDDDDKGFRRVCVVGMKTGPGRQSVSMSELRFCINWNR